uniref:DUF1287 domain-containing protein n=1 Tax=uncultured Thiotrichaceae bacterium TaxID=298394 RepID=A0A6S6TLU3_9GAMM|nr:MAG: DUF1287 domain-containing protein [uncultured Thiotrichaceae bacterium]
MRRFTVLSELFFMLLFAGAAWWIYPHIQQPSETELTGIEKTPQDTNFSILDLPGLLPEFRDFITPPPRLRPVPPEHVADVINSVYQQSEITHTYDPAYVKLAYPGGDVDPEVGVCTDVVVRAFREKNIDLQRTVHEDMRRNFRKYPKKWGLRKPDKNIDHRRVPNLMTFFKRQGVSLSISDNSNDYLPGDVVAWQLNEKQNHIGIVMKARSHDGERPLIGHNINSGTKIQDVLFDWEIVGHYRYFPEPVTKTAMQ